jgi:hypothetical protein
MSDMTHHPIAQWRSAAWGRLTRPSRVRAIRRDLPRRLDAFSGSFTDHHQRTDIEFNALAKSLRKLYEISQALAGLVGERLGLVQTALNESRIARPEGVAATALQDLRHGLAETDGELTLLQSVGGELWRLKSQVERIEQVGMSIRTSVFGFAVESARTDQCRQTFGSFAEELRSLGNRITGLAGAIGDDAGAAHTTLEKERKSLTENHAQLCQLAAQLETTANATAAAAQGMLDQVLRGLQKSEEKMRQITHHAGEALFYLQFGDIVRQKTEHIATALGETVEALKLAPSRAEFYTRASAADQVLAIQIGQLELIRAEVGTAQGKLAESFNALGEATGQMCEILGRWLPSSDNPGNKPDSLAAFKAALLRLEDSHRLGQELRQGARQSIENLAGVSQRLAGHIGNLKVLNFDIHLQALNAIVRTAALGAEGTTLSVLSVHVDLLCCESQGVVVDLVAILESVIQQTVSQAGGQEPAGEPAKNTRPAADLGNIESAFSECGTTFASAGKLVAEQQAAITGSQALLNFLANLDSAITDQIAELTACREMLAPCKSLATSAAAPTKTLNHLYTMQSERDIHNQAGQSASPGASPVAEDNVELFDAPPTRCQAASPPSPEPPSENATPPAAAVVSASATGSELGDNVDLF